FQDDVISAQDALPQKTPLVLSNEPRSLIIFNPTEQLRSSVISVVVDGPDARVVDAVTGRPMAAQISAVWAEPSRLSFVAQLPPLSLGVYHVTKAPAGSTQRAQYTVHRHGDPPTVHAEHFQVSHLQGPELRLQSGLVRQVQVQFLWYATRTGFNQEKSGAYLFLPREGGGQLYTSSEPPLVRVSRGPVFSDITSCFKHFTHTVRLYHLDGHAGRSAEITNMVDIRSEVNRELVMRLVSDVTNGNRFYTDLNGFQMQQRRTLQKLPLQANFYPMSSASFLQDSMSRLSLLSAQSQAAAALKPGEVVLDRRLQQDDNRGLGQGVTDNKLTAGLYHLLLEDRRGGVQDVGGASVEHLSLLAHLSSLSLCHPPLIMVAPSDSQLPELRPFLPLRSSLPCDVHLLNLRTLEDPQVRNTWPIIYWWGCHRLCWLGKFYRIYDEPESSHITRLRPMEISGFRTVFN
uniref:Glycosyl hydrolase family 38 C-terminal domain-containing protein n=1 Tax=Anabas testudineus TaxID=64144 RepID=A0AAQ6IT39_ANATE